MPNQVNQTTVQKLRDKVSRAKSIILTNYQGLTANQVNSLKDKLAQDDIELAVTKNTLLNIAFKEEKVPLKDATVLEGPTATIFAYKDALSPIKTLLQFAKDNDKLSIKGGIVEGVFVSVAEIDTLSKLPSKEELIAKVVGTIKSPLFGLVNVLGGTQRKLVYALAAVARKKEVS